MTRSRRLRIAFFTTDDPLGHSGIDRYTTDLLRELVKRDDLTVVPIASPRGVSSLREHVPGVDELIVTKAQRGPLRSAEERYGLGRRLERARLDVVHGTKHLLPRRVSCASVLTVYDLFAFTRRRDYRLSKQLLLPPVYRRSIARADRIIAMTDSIRRQLVANGLAEEHVVDVVTAAPSTTLTTAEPRAVPALDGVPFALCVGDLSARKNVDLLLRIWPSVHDRTGLSLALVGPDRSRSDEMHARLAALEAAGLMVRVGAVSDGALRWCYENTTVVLLPSFEEGYGLPAIEAASFAAELVTSCDPALVEVSGAATRHVDPHDDEAWKRAIDDAARPRSERALVVTATWPHIAELTAAVYRRAAT